MPVRKERWMGKMGRPSVFEKLKTHSDLNFQLKRKRERCLIDPATPPEAESLWMHRTELFYLILRTSTSCWSHSDAATTSVWSSLLDHKQRYCCRGSKHLLLYRSCTPLILGLLDYYVYLYLTTVKFDWLFKFGKIIMVNCFIMLTHTINTFVRLSKL